MPDGVPIHIGSTPVFDVYCFCFIQCIKYTGGESSAEIISISIKLRYRYAMPAGVSPYKV